MTGSTVKKVYALAMRDSNNNDDTISITLGYENGSIGMINYFANGDKGLPKEMIEIFCSGWTANIHDFKDIDIYQNGKKIRKKAFVQNKGQKDEIDKFISGILEPDNDKLIDINEIINTSIVTFGIQKSLKTGQVCLLDEIYEIT
jgi:polar amino acid transport system substrate-binding protein